MTTSDDAATAPGRKARRDQVIAAWAVLLGMGGSSVTFSIYNAVHGDPHSKNGHLALGLAVVVGVAPVGAAMGLSHLATIFRSKAYFVCTYAVMFGAMAMSAGATANVVAPVAHPGWLRWIFPFVLDFAAVLALKAVINPDEAAVDNDRQQPAKTTRVTGSGTGNRRLSGTGNAGSGTGTAAQYRAPAPVAGGTAEQKPAGNRKRQPNGSATDSHLDELDTEAKAFDLLRGNPDMTGADLDRALGFSKNSGRGRQLKRKLTVKYPEDLVPSGSPAGDRRNGQK